MSITTIRKWKNMKVTVTLLVNGKRIATMSEFCPKIIDKEAVCDILEETMRQIYL
jgi:hypothetical protein